MTTRLSLLFFTLLSCYSIQGQTNDNEKRQQVLEKGITDSLFVFGKWTENGQTETHLKYLGEVVTADGRVFKIMNSCWYWGLSHRATSRILVFNVKNEYVGNYYLGMTYDLPDKLEDGKLIFTNSDNAYCDQMLTTKIDLMKYLPKEIFIKCKDDSGDIYSFSAE